MDLLHCWGRVLLVGGVAPKMQVRKM